MTAAAIPNIQSMSDVDRELLRIDAELCERSLSEYLRQAWPVLEPEVTYLHNWHIDCIADYLTAVDLGQILRLVINVPPRSLKSTEVTIGWPTWTWTKKPWEKFMCSSYAAELSTEHSVDRRSLIESEWYQDRWGHVFELSSDQNVKSHFTNDRGGAMFSTGMTGKGMGFGCDKLIIDDPHDAQKAESEKERKTVIGNFRKKFSRRLNDKKTGAIVIVMQRLHAEDLAGVALEMGYTHLCLEGQAKKRRFISIPTTLPKGCPVVCDCATCTQRARDDAKRQGIPVPPEEREPPKTGKYIEREKGEYLHEEREGEAEHAQAKVELGPQGYAHQYDQLANPEDGIKFKRKNFRYFEDKGDHLVLHQPNGAVKRVLKSECIRVAIVDTAMSEETTADYTVIGEWWFTRDKDMLLDEILRERMEDPEVEAAVRNAIRRCAYLVVEKKQNGMTIFQRLVREGLAIRAITAEGDKIARSTTASIDSANGKIYFRANAPWLGDYENELLQFPNGAHDDQVDVTSYASIEKASEMMLEMPSGPVRQH
jgi:predicted phage terminase large subunit-like protein